MMNESVGWIAVGLSAALARGEVRGTEVRGSEVVVWRQASGSAHVWPDRCPHRGMRLSFGCVRDDLLACMYHGFRFDAAGRCRHVPADPEFAPPPSLAVPPFACTERGGFIWMHLDGNVADPPPAALDPTTVAQDSDWADVASLETRVSAESASAALADFHWIPSTVESAHSGADPVTHAPRQVEHAMAADNAGAHSRWQMGDGTHLTCACTASRIDQHLVALRAECSEEIETLAVAIQPLDAHRCMLHIRSTVTGHARRTARRHHLRVAARLRGALEAAGARP